MRRKHESKAGGSDTGSQTCRWGQQHQEVPFLPRVPRRPRRQCCSGSPGRHDIASWPKTCWLAPVSNHVISDYRILDDFGSWSAKGLQSLDRAHDDAFSTTYRRLVFGAILLAGCGSVTAWREKLPDGSTQSIIGQICLGQTAKLKSCSTSNHGDSASASGLHHGIHQLLP